MAGNLNIGVTADVTDLRSKMALAQQDLRAAEAALRSAAATARASGASWDQQATAISGAAQKAEAARSRMQTLRTTLDELRGSEAQLGQSVTAAGTQVESAHGRMAHSGGVAREVLVMMHETLMGNYTRLGGSTMVLAERTNVLHTAIQALGPASLGVIGAVGALAAGLAFLAMRAGQAAAELRNYTSAAALMGRDTEAATAQFNRIHTALAETGMGRADINAVAEAVARIPGVTEDTREKLAQLAPAIRAAFPKEDMEKSFGGVAAAMREGTAGVERYLKEIDALTPARLSALAAARADNDTSQAQTILLDALTTRLAGYNAELKRRQAFMADLNQNALMMGGAGASMADMPVLNLPKSPLPEAQAVDPSINRDREDTLALNVSNEERLKLTNQIAGAERDLQRATQAGNGADADNARAAIAAGKARLAALADPAQTEAYQRYAQQAQEAENAAVVSAANAGQKRAAITEAGVRAEIAVYQKAAADETLSDKQRLEARAEVVRLSTSLAKEESGARTAGANQAYEAEVAKYNAEIAAARGNAQQVMELEQRKLEFIRQAKGEESKEYQEALREQTSTLDSTINQQVRLIQEGGQRRIANEQAVLKTEAASRQITKAQEFDMLTQFVTSERDQELQSVNNLIETLQQGTAAYNAAIAARTKLIEEFGIKLQQINALAAANATSTADKMNKAFTGAFDKIGSSMQSALGSVLTSGETLQKGEQQVAKAMVEAFVSAAGTLAGQWATLELARLTTSAATQAQINTIQATQGATGFSTLLAHWIGLESSKTAITTSQAGVRATADSSGGFLASIGQMISHWLGMETTKTAATTTGAMTRTQIETTHLATLSATLGAIGRAEIATAAGIAAAFAFADSAEAGPAGLAAAPAAAATAESTVMAFQASIPSLDVGTSFVPHDMLAMIHEGEAVIPPYDAAMLRGGDTSIGGNAMNLVFNHSPTYAGTSAQARAQALRDNDDITGTIVNAFRNGQLRLPRR